METWGTKRAWSSLMDKTSGRQELGMPAAQKRCMGPKTKPLKAGGRNRSQTRTENPVPNVYP